jgi:hypothetical protein
MFQSLVLLFFFLGYVKNSRAQLTIALFDEIVNPNSIILSLFFNACAQVATEISITLAKKVFEQSPKDIQSDLYVLTSMLDASMKCGNVAYAETLFNIAAKKDLAMYATMMKGKNTKFVSFVLFIFSFKDTYKIIRQNRPSSFLKS